MANAGLCEESEGWGCIFAWHNAGEDTSANIVWADNASASLYALRGAEQVNPMFDLSKADEAFLASQLLQFTWKPQDSLRADVSSMISSMHWPPIKENGARAPVLAVHIRRGDACSCQGSECESTVNDGPRLCLPVSNYMTEALKIQEQTGVVHLLVATESASVISEIQQQWGDRFRIHHCPWDRTGYTSAVTHGSENVTQQLARIESLIEDNNITAQQVVVSAIAEVELLAEGTALVHSGTAFSTLARQLAKATRGVKLPEINLESLPPQTEPAGMPVFQSLVDPVPLETFFDNFYSKKVLHSTHLSSRFDSDALFEQIVDVFATATEEFSLPIGNKAQNMRSLNSLYSPIRHKLVKQARPTVRTAKVGVLTAVKPIIGGEAQARELLSSGTSIIINSFHNLRNRQPAMDDLIQEFISWKLPDININVSGRRKRIC
jgi:hypothetical protein